MKKPPTIEQARFELAKRLRMAKFKMNEAALEDSTNSAAFRWAKSEYEALLSFMHYLDPLYEEE